MRAKPASWALGFVGTGIWALAMAQGAYQPTPYSLQVPIGFPPPPLPSDNPLTVEGVALGQRLFNEVRLSRNDTESCASCHQPQYAFSNQGQALSIGILGLKGTRNAPALFDLAYQHVYFWDGRAPSLRLQALAPIQNHVEMDSSLTEVISKLQRDASYIIQFKHVFGTRGVTADRIGKALEQYELTLMSGNSKFDLSRQGKATLSAQEQRGFQLFTTPFNPRSGQFGADCARCHGGPLFSDFQFRNNGLDAVPADPGLEDVTGLPTDFGRFKTPSLRNLAVSGPYMHDGRFTTLEQVVEHYSSGIVSSPTLDPGLARENGGVNLSPSDQAALVAFLKTLTDSQFVSSAAP